MPITRFITFAGSTVAIEYKGPGASSIVRFLYGDIPPDDQQLPHTTFRLLSGNGSAQFRLYRNDELIHTGKSQAKVADILLGNTCYNLADRSQPGSLFHGAALARQGLGLLLPGTMGAGKSTLTAWLLGRGFDYLTDELVYILPASLIMQTFPRPLNLKRPSRAVLNRHLDFSNPSTPILSSPTTDLVPARLFNPSSKFSQPPLSLIIFPHYRAGSDFRLTPLSKAQAGLALMECLVNARNLSDHGFSEIARLTRAAPAYKLSYAGFDQIGNSIEALLEKQ